LNSNLRVQIVIYGEQRVILRLRQARIAITPMLEKLVVVRDEIVERYATEIRNHAGKPALSVRDQLVVHDRVRLEA
jgi:hypothetical protein